MKIRDDELVCSR